MSALLPCPFCGSTTHPFVTDFGITCADCHTQVCGAGTVGDAAAWNLRAAPASPAHASDKVPGHTSTLPPPAWRLIETRHREAIAKIIDPEAFETVEETANRIADELAPVYRESGHEPPAHDDPENIECAEDDFANRAGDRSEALAKAGAILALPTPSEDRDKGIGGEEEGSSVARGDVTPPSGASAGAAEVGKGGGS